MTPRYVYVFNTHRGLYQENTTQHPQEDGFEILHKHDRRTFSPSAKAELKEVIKNDKGRENISRVLQLLGVDRSGNPVRTGNASNTGAGICNGELDEREYREQSKSDQSNNDSRKDTGEVQKLETPDSIVYGFAKDGVVYLDPTLINPNTAIHEYTHLWDNALMKLNPTLWEKGKALMKQTPIWDEVINDPYYANIRDNEDIVASEVHSRLVGTDGAERLLVA